MNRRVHSCRGFTLVELMVSSALAAVLMAGVFSTFIYLAVNLTRLTNRRCLEAKAREALGYFSQDLRFAESIESGTTPTSTSVTLVLPSGNVTYTFNSATGVLERQATFGANTSFNLLYNGTCSCTAFAFTYYTTTGGSPISQVTAGANVPLSIKLVQMSFTLRTPTGSFAGTQETYSAASSQYLMRNKQLPGGT